ncbi:hypothetical protein PILCRDRAFT_811954 [Piloderma croceum F 1598]|uniref:F-box domain-containing protein n=1 Tax=Piloderma croceum (strain F 1598) TaxID=765440 RepID=A0A0C3BUM8_PILCF|nr:hypothetical protein PILCRDRAFT_811954 [Piloderma croceum F 1598]
MPSLSDLPVDVLLDNLLPSIPVPDVLNLASTNRFFAILGADDTFWKRKLQDDFNFSGAGTARTSGWKVIYKGLSKPRIYTWGTNEHGRLGLTNPPKAKLPGVPFPARLRIPGVRIVSLMAGGMSFHALDSEGNVYVWGTLDGSSYALKSDGFEVASKTTNTPLKLAMPVPMRSISCGRLHSSGLDANSQIWTFLNWGRPFRLTSSLLDCSTPDSTPVQVECGWAFSSVLTKAGNVYVWFPNDSRMEEIIESHDNTMNAEHHKAVATPDKVIPCSTWDLNLNPVRLPALPSLPALVEIKGETKLIKIAGSDQNLIGLTNQGHVLKFDSLNNELSASRGTWTYLPNFSQVDRVLQHQVFSPADDKEKHISELPQTMQITHISAQFKTFVAYSTGSSSIVLMGNQRTRAESQPTILPELQNKGVISVVLGDYHFGALTAAGKLFTWGQYSNGALGLGDPTDIEPGQPGGFLTQDHRQMALNRGRGDPPNVTVPTEVRFEKKRKQMFCFAAAAAGWHMGALVIDLEMTADDDAEDIEESDDNELHMPGHLGASAPPSSFGPGELPPFARGARIFRVGFAGRGMNRGRGRGQ